jgi:uncharacterized repeat protein (TIGR01451 family)
VTCATTELPPGATTTCTSAEPHVITQDELDEGRVVNVATVSGVNAESVGSTDDDGAVTPLVGGEAVELVKTAEPVQDANGNGVTDAGDTLRFRFVVTNTGTVSVNTIVVDDPLLSRAGVALNCPSRGLAPGESLTCVSAPYTITDADARRGQVVNAAQADGTSARGDATGVSPAAIKIELGADVASPSTPLQPNGGLAGTGSPIAPWIPVGGLLLTLLGALIVLRRPTRTTDRRTTHTEKE